jgi:hypothetical protein
METIGGLPAVRLLLKDATTREWRDSYNATAEQNEWLAQVGEVDGRTRLVVQFAHATHVGDVHDQLDRACELVSGNVTTLPFEPRHTLTDERPIGSVVLAWWSRWVRDHPDPDFPHLS